MPAAPRALGLALALAACAACARTPAPRPASAPPPPASAPSASQAAAPASLVPASPSSAAVEGLYLTSSRERSGPSCYVGSRRGGVWVECGRSMTRTALEPHGAGWLVSLRDEDGSEAAIPLEPPAQAGGGWRLLFPNGVVYEQRVDPFLASVREHLNAGGRFVRIDGSRLPKSGRVEDAYTKDVITVLDGFYARVELEKGGSCVLGALLPDPTWNQSVAPGTPAAPPKPGALGMRMYLLIEVVDACPSEPPDFVRKGLIGGVKLFADSKGTPMGMLLVGYMYGELFVAPGVTWDQFQRMGKAMRDEQELQAE